MVKRIYILSTLVKISNSLSNSESVTACVDFLASLGLLGLLKNDLILFLVIQLAY